MRKEMARAHVMKLWDAEKAKEQSATEARELDRQLARQAKELAAAEQKLQL